jgi:hypothetical protein
MQITHRLCAALLTGALAIMGAQSACAHSEWPDGPHKEWFQSLQRPDNHLNPRRDEKSRYCCGMADVVDTKFKVESSGGAYPQDTWYAWLNGSWVKVPPEKIVPEFAPTGRGYLFILGNTIQCFVKPKGGS